MVFVGVAVPKTKKVGGIEVVVGIDVNVGIGEIVGCTKTPIGVEVTVGSWPPKLGIAPAGITVSVSREVF
jgi:hypothetical protein